MSETTRYTVTIVVRTDADPSHILDEAHELGESLMMTLQSYGCSVSIDEQDTCVSHWDGTNRRNVKLDAKGETDDVL